VNIVHFGAVLFLDQPNDQPETLASGNPQCVDWFFIDRQFLNILRKVDVIFNEN